MWIHNGHEYFEVSSNTALLQLPRLRRSSQVEITRCGNLPLSPPPSRPILLREEHTEYSEVTRYQQPELNLRERLKCRNYQGGARITTVRSYGYILDAWNAFRKPTSTQFRTVWGCAFNLAELGKETLSVPSSGGMWIRRSAGALNANAHVLNKTSPTPETLSWGSKLANLHAGKWQDYASGQEKKRWQIWKCTLACIW